MTSAEAHFHTLLSVVGAFSPHAVVKVWMSGNSMNARMVDQKSPPINIAKEVRKSSYGRQVMYGQKLMARDEHRRRAGARVRSSLPAAQA